MESAETTQSTENTQSINLSIPQDEDRSQSLADIFNIPIPEDPSSIRSLRRLTSTYVPPHISMYLSSELTNDGNTQVQRRYSRNGSIPFLSFNEKDFESNGTDDHRNSLSHIRNIIMDQDDDLEVFDEKKSKRKKKNKYDSTSEEDDEFENDAKSHCKSIQELMEEGKYIVDSICKFQDKIVRKSTAISSMKSEMGNFWQTIVEKIQKLVEKEKKKNKYKFTVKEYHQIKKKTELMKKLFNYEHKLNVKFNKQLRKGMIRLRSRIKDILKEDEEYRERVNMYRAHLREKDHMLMKSLIREEAKIRKLRLYINELRTYVAQKDSFVLKFFDTAYDHNLNFKYNSKEDIITQIKRQFIKCEEIFDKQFNKKRAPESKFLVEKEIRSSYLQLRKNHEYLLEESLYLLSESPRLSTPPSKTFIEDIAEEYSRYNMDPDVVFSGKFSDKFSRKFKVEKQSSLKMRNVLKTEMEKQNERESSVLGTSNESALPKRVETLKKEHVDDTLQRKRLASMEMNRVVNTEEEGEEEEKVEKSEEDQEDDMLDDVFKSIKEGDALKDHNIEFFDSHKKYTTQTTSKVERRNVHINQLENEKQEKKEELDKVNKKEPHQKVEKKEKSGEIEKEKDNDKKREYKELEDEKNTEIMNKGDISGIQVDGIGLKNKNVSPNEKIENDTIDVEQVEINVEEKETMEMNKTSINRMNENKKEKEKHEESVLDTYINGNELFSPFHSDSDLSRENSRENKQKIQRKKNRKELENYTPSTDVPMVEQAKLLMAIIVEDFSDKALNIYESNAISQSKDKGIQKQTSNQANSKIQKNLGRKGSSISMEKTENKVGKVLDRKRNLKKIMLHNDTKEEIEFLVSTYKSISKVLHQYHPKYYNSKEKLILIQKSCRFMKISLRGIRRDFDVFSGFLDSMNRSFISKAAMILQRDAGIQIKEQKKLNKNGIDGHGHAHNNNKLKEFFAVAGSPDEEQLSSRERKGNLIIRTKDPAYHMLYMKPPNVKKSFPLQDNGSKTFRVYRLSHDLASTKVFGGFRPQPLTNTQRIEISSNIANEEDGDSDQEFNELVSESTSDSVNVFDHNFKILKNREDFRLPILPLRAIPKQERIGNMPNRNRLNSFRTYNETAREKKDRIPSTSR